MKKFTKMFDSVAAFAFTGIVVLAVMIAVDMIFTRPPGWILTSAVLLLAAVVLLVLVIEMMIDLIVDFLNSFSE